MNIVLWFNVSLFVARFAIFIKSCKGLFLEKEFGRELRTDINYPFVNNNLNPKLKLRAYQKQAFTRFYKYCETSDEQDYLLPYGRLDEYCFVV
jgi:hypothetical protein